MVAEPISSAGSRNAILGAASIEFSLHGFSGTRMEHVAARAGCNKALIYRYFGDREGLFRAVLHRLFEERERRRERVPPGLAQALVYWFRNTVDSGDFERLLLREALNDDGGEVVEEESRRRYYRRQIETLREWQEAGRVVGDLDPTYLFLALLALIAYPGTFPQITRLVTGHAPDSKAFDRRWSRLLRGLARCLCDEEESR